MKPPTKPPVPPSPSSNRGMDEPASGPTSGRARKDVNYVPSASFRAKAPLPSASLQPAGPGEIPAVYEDDLLEDAATPTRTPRLRPESEPPAATVVAPPLPEWQPLPTGPMQPIGPPPAAPPPPPAPPPPIAAPPSSSRSFSPPSSQPSFQPSSSGSLAPMRVASSGRVRQVHPLDAPMAPPSQGGLTASQQRLAHQVTQQQITGPQLPLALQPRTGSFPSAVTQAPPLSSTTPRGGAPTVDEGMPLGYVVASAFFLAIALVGFGLYLAFEVISL